jgi:hypothetical protein
MWGVLSDERTGLSFAIATGPRQRTHSRVRVPWDSRPYFTVSDSRLPFSSPPTTRRATVEVFDPASSIPCGGGVEYLYRSPASRRRQRKGNLVPGVITARPCSGGM